MQARCRELAEISAAAANIKQLVFYHMVPTPANPLMARMFERDLSDKTITAKDLITFVLPVESTDIISK